MLIFVLALFANVFLFIYHTANPYIRSDAWSELNEFDQNKMMEEAQSMMGGMNLFGNMPNQGGARGASRYAEISTRYAKKYEC